VICSSPILAATSFDPSPHRSAVEQPATSCLFLTEQHHPSLSPSIEQASQSNNLL
jgi:hypothetical protein